MSEIARRTLLLGLWPAGAAAALTGRPVVAGAASAFALPFMLDRIAPGTLLTSEMHGQDAYLLFDGQLLARLPAGSQPGWRWRVDSLRRDGNGRIQLAVVSLPQR